MTLYGVLLVFALYCGFVIIGISMAINEEQEQSNEYEVNKNNINDSTDFIKKIEKF